MNTIFVYGTLKREHGNYARFIAPDTTHNFIGEAVSTDTDYRMMCYGAPMLFKSYTPNDGHPVKGELYEVSDETFARIDRLEGHPRVYRREQQKFVVIGDAAQVVEAWVYLSAHSFPADLEKIAPPLNDTGQLVWPRPPKKPSAEPQSIKVFSNTNKMYRELTLVHDGDPIDFEDLDDERRRCLTLQQRAVINALSTGGFEICIAPDGTTTLAFDTEDALAYEDDYDDE